MVQRSNTTSVPRPESILVESLPPSRSDSISYALTLEFFLQRGEANSFFIWLFDPSLHARMFGEASFCRLASAA